MAKNQEISVYFSANAILASRPTILKLNFKVQNALVSKRGRALLSWKVVNRYKFSTSYAW